MFSKVLGIIPARGGSKGIPKKNIVDVCGKPLIVYSIETALQSQCLTDHLVSTDSEEIAEIARIFGANVPFIRPPELAGDKAPTIGVVLHALDFMERTLAKVYDAVVLLQPTTPLRSALLIDEGVKKLMVSDVDSVISVVDVGAHHPFRMYTVDDADALSPFVVNVSDPMMPRQQLPRVYIRSGDLYIVRRQCLVDKGSLIGDRSLAIVIESNQTVNIDTIEDLLIARHRLGRAP